jgi:hypothetical protein
LTWTLYFLFISKEDFIKLHKEENDDKCLDCDVHEFRLNDNRRKKDHTKSLQMHKYN